MKLLWALAAILVLMLGGCCSSRYDTSTVGVGYSAVIDEMGELDLKDQLDASLLPDMLSQAYKEGLEAGKKKDELQRFVVRKLSQDIREISTVDLDGNGETDPVLVVPEGDDEQMTFSVRVPDPSVYGQGKKSLPDIKDAAAWQKLAENEAVELLALTAVPKIENGRVAEMEFESRPSGAFYSEPSYYHHRSSSGLNSLLTYMVVRDMFYRPMWYGPSYYHWYGGYYRPYYVSNVYSRRTSTVTRYKSGKTSYGRLKTSSGRMPSRSKSSQLASKKSFTAAKDVRTTAKSRSGGFGRGTTARSSSSTGRGSSSGGFGRSSSGRSSSTRYGSSSRSSRGGFFSSFSSGGSRGGK
jgi:hypothetical protein